MYKRHRIPTVLGILPYRLSLLHIAFTTLYLGTDQHILLTFLSVISLY
jgi:hypothetical protein